MLINVLGLGYIGAPTAFILSKEGYKVYGTDINENVIQDLSTGRFKTDEPGLQQLMEEAIQKEISFGRDCIKADIYIVAVPTPFLKQSKRIDTKFLIEAIDNICKVCPSEAIIAIESTVAPKTIDKYVRSRIPTEKKIHLAHVPERIIPGKILDELKNNSRTIGVDDYETGEILTKVYSSFCKGEIIVTDICTAEMTKVIENTYRDINIAFANELTKICDYAGLDVYEVIKIANKHPRVNILNPGPGVGGHCISVDPWFLVGDYPGLANIILAARRINDSMPEFVLLKVRRIMEKYNINSLDRVGFYGLTYKENVDDIRESPTLQLIECMKNHLAEGALFYDPFVKKALVSRQAYSLNEFINQIDIVVIMVGHKEIVENQSLLGGKIVFDTRNVLKDIDVELL